MSKVAFMDSNVQLLKTVCCFLATWFMYLRAKSRPESWIKGVIDMKTIGMKQEKITNSWTIEYMRPTLDT